MPPPRNVQLRSGERRAIAPSFAFNPKSSVNGRAGTEKSTLCKRDAGRKVRSDGLPATAPDRQSRKPKGRTQPATIVSSRRSAPTFFNSEARRDLSQLLPEPPFAKYLSNRLCNLLAVCSLRCTEEALASGSTALRGTMVRQRPQALTGAVAVCSVLQNRANDARVLAFDLLSPAQPNRSMARCKNAESDPEPLR